MQDPASLPTVSFLPILLSRSRSVARGIPFIPFIHLWIVSMAGPNIAGDRGGRGQCPPCDGVAGELMK